MQTATLCTVFYLSFLYSQNAFPSGTPGTFQHWTTQHTEIFKVPLDSVIFTRSVRGLYEICTRSGFCKARQGKAAGIFSTLPFSALRLSNHFYSSISSIRFSSRLYSSTLLLYSSTVLSSVWVKLLRSHPHEFLSQKHVCPCKVLEKSMPQTIDSSSKNYMYIIYWSKDIPSGKQAWLESLKKKWGDFCQKKCPFQEISCCHICLPEAADVIMATS